MTPSFRNLFVVTQCMYSLPRGLWQTNIWPSRKSDQLHSKFRSYRSDKLTLIKSKISATVIYVLGVEKKSLAAQSYTVPELAGLCYIQCSVAGWIWSSPRGRGIFSTCPDGAFWIACARLTRLGFGSGTSDGSTLHPPTLGLPAHRPTLSLLSLRSTCPPWGPVPAELCQHCPGLAGMHQGHLQPMWLPAPALLPFWVAQTCLTQTYRCKHAFVILFSQRYWQAPAEQELWIAPWAGNRVLLPFPFSLFPMQGS